MTVGEIERIQYRNMMKIRCIEAEVSRVSPFSEEFELLVNESLRLQDEQKNLAFEKVKVITQEQSN